jgi:hypothetical protein
VTFRVRYARWALSEPLARANSAIVLRAVWRCERWIDDIEDWDFARRLRRSRRPISKAHHARLMEMLERVVRERAAISSRPAKPATAPAAAAPMEPKPKGPRLVWSKPTPAPTPPDGGDAA